MIPTGPIPDALFVPERMKHGDSVIERVNSILRFAEPMLGIDRNAGGRAYIRRQGHGVLFISPDLSDSINFPLNTPFRCRPRYRWIDRPDGIRLGYLVPEARELKAPAFDPIKAGIAPFPGMNHS
jgi:hypothetical protein